MTNTELVKYSDKDIHKLDSIIKKLANRKVMLMIALLSFIVGLLASIINQDWQWVSRFSSVIVISGLFLTMSPIFVKGVYISQSNVDFFAEVDGDDDEKIIVTSSQDREIGKNIIYGIGISIIGTFLWGFGDLVLDWLYKII